MIRLSEDVVTEVQKRRCPPAEHFIFSIRIQMWPVFQKAMSENVDALKKLAEGSSAGYFSRATITTDAMVAMVSTPPVSADICSWNPYRYAKNMLCYSMHLCTWPSMRKRQWYFQSMLSVVVTRGPNFKDNQPSQITPRVSETRHTAYRTNTRRFSKSDGAIGYLRGRSPRSKCSYEAQLHFLTPTNLNAIAKHCVHGTSEVPTRDCFLGQPRGGNTPEDCICRADEKAVVSQEHRVS